MLPSPHDNLQTLFRSALLLAIVMGCGCTARNLNANLASWQGSHIDDVLSVWGAPDSCSVTAGQKVCSWGENAARRPDAVSMGTESAPVAGTRSPCVRSLAVGPSGYVTGWRWRGSHCAASIAVARAD